MLNAIVILECLCLVVLALLFCLNGEWRLGIVQALYGAATVLIFFK